LRSKVLKKDISDLEGLNVIDQIIAVAAMSYDRIPVMEMTFEKYALQLASSLKVTMATPVDVSLENVDYMTCAEAVQDFDMPSFFSLSDTGLSSDQVGLVLDASLFFNMLEIMMGGGKFANRKYEKRNFSVIEKKLGTKFCENALQAMTEALSQYADMKFVINAVENNPKNAMIAPLSAACMRAIYKVTMNGHKGILSIIIPNSILEKHPNLMLQNFMGGRISEGETYQKNMVSMIQEADIDLTSVISEISLSLEDLLNIKLNDIIPLDIEPDEDATVYCSDHSMFKASIGHRKNGYMAAKVTSDIMKQKDQLVLPQGI
jgi:flagellar motor switch protein FliM